MLDWLQSAGGLTGEIRSPELQRIHIEMCGVIGWDVRPWNPVAAALTKMTSGRKVYRYFGPQRLRVFPIVASPALTRAAVARTDSTAALKRRAA